jgi:two-component system, NarL family, nitrate/nitrite response regulator NarL
MHSQQRSPIRILIIDDHAVLRLGLRAFIESDQRMRVVGEASDHSSAVAVAIEQQPDIILLDLDLGNDNGFDLMPEVLQLVPDARLIVLTGVRDSDAHQRAVLLGAMGLVLKEKALDSLLKAIEKVYQGEVWLDRTMIASVLNSRARNGTPPEQNAYAAQIATLTEREHEVIQLIGEGMRNKEIAEHLVISEATVRNHLTSIFSKIGVNDRFELVVFAYRYGLCQLPKKPADLLR